MHRRCLESLGVLAAVIAVVALVPAPLAGQAPTATKTTATAKASIPPRTPWGHPDLQGVWNSGTLTPLERREEFAGREFFTDQEAAAIEGAERLDRPPAAGDPGTYNQFWFDPGTKVARTRRTSLVIDPPDGRIPPLTTEAQKRSDANRQTWRGPAASWLDRDTGERCLTDGLPITPLQSYNLNFQILQTPEYVAIFAEMYHDLRIIPLDGRPHGKLPQWLGDGRGHWEGDTLVVDTTTFADKSHYIWAWPWRTATAGLHLVERFRRVAADAIDYQFTIVNPAILTRPFTAEVPLTRLPGQIYEYACHEGNYAMLAILSAGRAQEANK